ncbi:MAG: alpha/beta hydrolase fold domain-containing protein [Gammaproteobacteria bacterium]|nr:alpha/beta hydrolase fold domain-containing protein [Gammaproteobacteria bacterium]
MSGDLSSPQQFDVVVVGAGFAGLYLIHKLRELGFSVRCVESADGVGGTWYWNRYPGARCDIQSIDYSYSFDPELDRIWQWSEKFATQPEILRYLNFVADHYDLRRDIEFNTCIASAVWDEATRQWVLTTNHGQVLKTRFYVMATGCLSQPKDIDIPGADRFQRDSYVTGRWPHEGVDFTGKRVAVIGTGSSGIQSIPLIAQQAAELYVYQRTPNFSMPARNGPVPEAKRAVFESDTVAYRESARWTVGGVPGAPETVSALSLTPQQQDARLHDVWESGDLLHMIATFSDTLTNEAANEVVAEFMRKQIRATVNDPATAEALCPYSFPFGTKRPCLDTNYYETFNLPHVHLVDLRRDPIVTVTETGIQTANGHLEFDAIVFATGFDAMTGALVAVDIRGRDGRALKDKWAHGPETYLGLMTNGFPNLFLVTGPGSPSVLSNMAVSIEQHVEFIGDCLTHLRDQGYEVIEPTERAERGWVKHVNAWGDLTLYPKANSWYMGANVPGKPRVFLPYVGGVDRYRAICRDVVAQDYLGFVLSNGKRVHCVDGNIRPIAPDVELMLDFIASLDAPPMETMSATDARDFARASGADAPPGPQVGEELTGTLPGPAGALAFQMFRPATPGPHPIVVYFHGGGWVLGSEESDAPLCRDLCVRTDAIILSVDYRHAPEARYPAAVEDAYAALCWTAANAYALGGDPERIAVAGWSAGGNLAAVVCQLARDRSGPQVAGQLLITPVTDHDFTRESYVANADGYVLTTSLMQWFWDHYADTSDRNHPTASPLRAVYLGELPPALVITSEFDPLRDEGAAYATRLSEAGVEARHLHCEGHTHMSLAAVDIIGSGVFAREEMAAAIRRFFG